MTLTLIPHAHARALREDAVTAPATGFALAEIGASKLYALPYRKTMRVGEEPKRDILHMNMRDFHAKQDANAIYARKPVCRECGRPIEHGSKVVVFGFKPSGWNPWGRRAFLHLDPEECKRPTAAA